MFLFRNKSGLALGLLVAMTLVLGCTSAKARGIGEDDASWIVTDAEMVMKFNVKQLMSSKLMQTIGLDKIKDGLKDAAELKTILDNTGMDPTKDIDTILISAAGTNPADMKAQVVVRGNFDTDKFHKVLSKREGVTPHTVAGKNVYEFEGRGGQSGFAAFVDNKTMVMTQSKEATAELAKGMPKKATISKLMKSATDKFSGKESMTMAVVINEELRKGMQNSPRNGEELSKLQTVTAALSITDSLVLNLTGVTNDEAASKTLSKMVDQGKAAAKLFLGMNEQVPGFLVDLLDEVKVGNTKDNITIDLKIPKETIDKMLKLGGTR